MNKDNAKDFLPLAQALADGKTLQFQAKASDPWKDIEHFDTSTWQPSRFRIKPEPREWILFRSAFNGPYLVVTNGNEFPTGEDIRVREIID